MRYKSLLKTVSRDASLRARHAADISGALRGIERWLAETRVAAYTHASEFASWLPHYRGHTGVGGREDEDDSGDDDGDDDDDDEVLEPTEAWALDRFCDALLEKGALVPVSRKSVLHLSSLPLSFPLSLSTTRASQKKRISVRAPLTDKIPIFMLLNPYL
jgi:ribosomal biogenesis protein LAS1